MMIARADRAGQTGQVDADGTGHLQLNVLTNVFITDSELGIASSAAKKKDWNDGFSVPSNALRSDISPPDRILWNGITYCYPDTQRTDLSNIGSDGPTGPAPPVRLALS